MSFNDRTLIAAATVGAEFRLWVQVVRPDVAAEPKVGRGGWMHMLYATAMRSNRNG